MAVQVAAGRIKEPVAVQGELSIVEIRVAPLALSRFRQRTVSSRNHEKFLSWQTMMKLKGGSSWVESPITPSKSRRIPAGSWHPTTMSCSRALLNS